MAGGISDKISDFINEVLRLPDTADKKLFLDPAELLLAAAEDLQNSIFDVDSSLSILELYRIDSEIDQLKIELDEYKKKLQTPVTPAPYVTTTPSCKSTLFDLSTVLIIFPLPQTQTPTSRDRTN